MPKHKWVSHGLYRAAMAGGLGGVLALLVSGAVAREPVAAGPAAPTGVIDLWGGGSESIALKADGTVWTWGWDQYGMLGNGQGTLGAYTGTEHDSWVPFEVLGPGGVGHLISITAIAGGERHNAALDASGNVWTWGLHSYGQLGIGVLADCTSESMIDVDCMRTTPVKISNFTSVKAIASRGYHTLALKTNGSVWAWGWNYFGQIGTGFKDFLGADPIEFSPVPVIGLIGHGKVLTLSGGGDVSAALMEDHTLMAWGDNTSGAVGNGHIGPRAQFTPTEVLTSTGLLSVTMIATGWTHMVALDATGHVWTWGLNDYGELGIGSQGVAYSSSVPIRLGGVLSNVIGVSAGDGSSVALTADGHVWIWGVLRTQVGANSQVVYDYGSSPVPVAGIDHVVLVRDRDWHVLALKADGSVWAWGWNLKGQIGDGTVGGDKTTPVRVSFPAFYTYLPLAER